MVQEDWEKTELCESQRQLLQAAIQKSKETADDKACHKKDWSTSILRHKSKGKRTNGQKQQRKTITAQAHTFARSCSLTSRLA